MPQQHPTLTVLIARPSQVCYEGAAHALHCVTTEGHVTILPHHAPYAAPLLRGHDIIVRPPEGEEVRIDVNEGGVIEVREGVATILLS